MLGVDSERLAAPEPRRDEGVDLARGGEPELDDARLAMPGFDRLKALWQGSGSFTHRRFSLVPSFKIQIDVHGDAASLYFECHDASDFDLATRQIASDTFLAGTVRRTRRG